MKSIIYPKKHPSVQTIIDRGMLITRIYWTDGRLSAQSLRENLIRAYEGIQLTSHPLFCIGVVVMLLLTNIYEFSYSWMGDVLSAILIISSSDNLLGVYSRT